MLRDHADKAIATAWHGLNVLRLSCGIAQRLAQAVYGCVQPVFKVAVAVSRPKLLLEFFTRYQSFWVLGKHDQDLDCLAGKLETDAVFPQFPGLGQELEETKPQRRRDLAVLSHSRCQDARVYHVRPRKWPSQLGATSLCNQRLGL